MYLVSYLWLFQEINLAGGTMNFVFYLWFVLYMTKRHSKFTIVISGTPIPFSSSSSYWTTVMEPAILCNET